MLLARLVETSEAVRATRSRKQKVARLAACLGDLEGPECSVGVALLAGELRQGRIGVGPALVREVLSAPAPASEGATLTLADVDLAFDEIAASSGPGAKTRRADALRSLFGRATMAERDFLARALVGEVRQGALEGVFVEALALASDVPAERVRRAVMLGGDLVAVGRAVLEGGAEAVAAFRLRVLRPVQPMLAESAPDVATGLASALAAAGRGGAAALEWKLDGVRLQLHRAGDEVRLFTRQQHDVTHAAPEIAAAVRALDVADCVLDAEALAFDGDRPRPFQETMRRFGRKLDVEVLARELPLSLFVFDVLHVAGRDVYGQENAARWSELERVVPPRQRVPRLVTADLAAGTAFLAEALAHGHEGLVVKTLGGTYEAGRRGAQWIKVKPAHTLDLVVLAAEPGSGRRAGTLSNLHLGARDETTGDFVMLGKTFKGLTDELLAWQTRELEARAVAREGYVLRVRPELVVEIAFDGVQRSPQYPGGVALRFARVKRYRPDKRADQADTLAAVRALLPLNLSGETDP